MGRRSRVAAGILVAIGLMGWPVVRRLERVVVEGASMSPTLAAGDRLIVWRTRRGAAGRMIVLADPRRPERWIVKRVLTRLPDGALDVRGDDPDASTDSRHFGPIPVAAVIGRPVYRYAPRSRAGRLGVAGRGGGRIGAPRHGDDRGT